MNVLLINGSPKYKESASSVLLEDLKACLPSEYTVTECALHTANLPDGLLDELSGYDALVFLYPLYVDGMPSHLLSCLCQLENQHAVFHSGCKVYGIVNCGFYEGLQCRHAIDILRHWCTRMGLFWGMGIGVGGGGAFSALGNLPVGKGPKKSLGAAYNQLTEQLKADLSAENIYISVDVPRVAYRLGGEMGWKRQIKENGGTVGDLDRRLD